MAMLAAVVPFLASVGSIFGGGAATGALVVGTAVGGVAKAVGSIQAGNAAAKAGAQQEQQDNYNAIQAQAASQRGSADELRKSRLIQSRAQAIAAASGAGATDTTVTDIIDNIAGEGQYRSMLDLYQGDENARNLRLRGSAALEGGKQAQTGGYYSAAGSLLKTGTSLFAAYGGGAPSMPTASKYPDWAPGD